MNRDLKAILILTGAALVLSIGAFAGLANGSEDLDCEGATHCLLMSFPRHVSDKDEPGAERWERVKQIAKAIDAATSKRIERAWLAMTIYEESRMARYVDLDWPRCREGKKGTCDGGKAYGVTQVHGTDRQLSRKQLFERSLVIVRRGGNYCKKRGFPFWSGGISQYARGGRHCEWKSAAKRVARMWNYHWRLGQ